MKINSFDMINFSKKLQASCEINHGGKELSYEIYQLDSNNSSDKDYFQNVMKDKVWDCSFYIGFADEDFKLGNKKDRFYALENTQGKCIAYCEVEDKLFNKMKLKFLEVAPPYKNNKENICQYEYFGETLLVFLAKLAKKENKRKIVLDSAKSATGFYERYFFERIGGFKKNQYQLDKKYYDILAEKCEGEIEHKLRLLV